MTTEITVVSVEFEEGADAFEALSKTEDFAFINIEEYAHTNNPYDAIEDDIAHDEWAAGFLEAAYAD